MTVKLTQTNGPKTCRKTLGFERRHVIPVFWGGYPFYITCERCEQRLIVGPNGKIVGIKR